MITVSIEKLEKELDKYIKLAKKEEVMVTKNGEHILSFVPKQASLKERWESLSKSLPKEVLLDKDIDREWTYDKVAR